MKTFLTLRIVIYLGFWALTAFTQTVADGVRHVLICEHDTQEIKCPASTTIQPSTIHYGQEYIGAITCNDNKTYDERIDPCFSSRAQAAVNERCQGKTTCTIEVNKRTFNDRPCEKNIAIYLHVAYVCVSSSTQTISSTKNLRPDIVAPSSVGADGSGGAQTCGPCVGCVTCFRCRKRDINWPETAAGTWASAECPNNPTLSEAKLLCGSNPVAWVGRPDLSKCTSSKVGDLQKRLKNTKNLNIESLDSLASELVNYAATEESLTGGDLIGISQSMNQVVEKFGVLTSHDTSDSNRHYKLRMSAAVMKMTSSLLDGGRNASWADIPKSNWGSLATRMMASVEASAFQMVDALTSRSAVNITKNILLEVSVIEADASSSEEEDFVFPKVESIKGSSWENIHSSFRLPTKALAHNRRVKVLFASYNNLENLLLPVANGTSFCSDLDDSEECNLVVNTRIITASIDSHKTKGSETTLQDPVVFTLEHKKTENVSNPICAFWKFSERDEEGGEWSDEGCLLIESNLTHTTCSCNHLTSFAVIMSPTSPEMTEANALALDVLTYIGCSISIICLFFSFLTFACFRNLQCDRNTIHKNLVLCLFIVNMIFLIGIDLASLKILCSVIAGFLHYFFLTVFAWMCIEGIQLYYMLVEVFDTDKSHVKWFYLSAYGVPALVVAISAAVYHQGYGTDRYCWLTPEKGFVWAFLGPASAIILVNCAMLVIALRAMYKHTVSAAAWRMKEKSKIQQARSWVKGSIVLVVLLGLTWAFGLAFVSESTIAFAYVFTILNSLQGLFIFIFHCLLNDKVQAEYKRFVKKADWLPERFREWYTGSRGSSLLNNSRNQTHSSAVGGGPFSRLLSRQRKSSQSTSVSRITSQKQSSLKKQENATPNVVIANDSGIEDPSSYLESALFHLGESEFNTMGISSAFEGSIVDTNYCEKLAKRPELLPQTGQSQGTNINLASEELETRDVARKRETACDAGSLRASSTVGDPAKNFQPNLGRIDEGVDVSQSERPVRTKRKSTKKLMSDENVSALQKTPVNEEFSVNTTSADTSGYQPNGHERNLQEHYTSEKPPSSSVRSYNRMPKSTGV